MVYADVHSVYDEKLLVTVLSRGNGAGEASVDRVILELVHHVVEIHEGIVHGGDLYFSEKITKFHELEPNKG
jgi:hypothetical protein